MTSRVNFVLPCWHEHDYDRSTTSVLFVFFCVVSIIATPIWMIIHYRLAVQKNLWTVAVRTEDIF